MEVKRIFSADLLKVMAMFAICGAHIMSVIEFMLPRSIVLARVDQSPYWQMSLGLYALNVFLFLGGFFLTLNPPTSMRDFFFKRALRFGFALLPCLLIVSFFWGLNAKQWFHYLSFTANFLPLKEQPAPWLWYLSLDLQLHLVCAPLIMVLRTRWRAHTFVILIVLSAASLVWRFYVSEHYSLVASYLSATYPRVVWSYYEHVHMMPWARLMPFLTGALCALVTKRRPPLGTAAMWASLTTAGALLFCVFLQTQFNLTDARWVAQSWWIATHELMVSLALFFYILGTQNWELRCLTLPLRWLAKLTLPIYLIHVAVIIALLRLDPLWWVTPSRMLLLWVLVYGLTIPLAFMFWLSLRKLRGATGKVL